MSKRCLASDLASSESLTAASIDATLRQTHACTADFRTGKAIHTLRKKLCSLATGSCAGPDLHEFSSHKG